MDPATLALLGGGLMSGLAGLLNPGASRGAAITREQAGITQSATEETMRRAEGQQSQTLASAAAGTGASGFSTTSGSFNNYLTSMAEQFQKQNAFTRLQGMQKVDLLNKAADAQDTNYLTKGLNLGTDLLGTANAYYKATNAAAK